MRQTWRHRIIVLVGLGSLGGLLFLAFYPAPIRVDLVRIANGPLRVTVDAEGKTRVRHRAVISAPVSGRLERITLVAGDPVAPELVVARLDPLPLAASMREAWARIAEWRAQRAGVETLRPKQQALAQLRARIAAAQSARLEAEARAEQARAALAQAQREVQRAQRLEAVGALAREERETLELTATTRTKAFDAAQIEVQRGTAEVAAAEAELAKLEAERHDPDYLLDVYSARIDSIEAELAKLQDDARRTEIRAPFSGQVLRVFEEHERVVTAGTPLLEIGDVARIELVIDILSADAVHVQPGMAVYIEQWGGEAALLARVRLVEPAAFTKVSALGVEEQRVNVIADFVDMSLPLGDGYRVEARLVIWEAQDVLKAPLSALFRCQNTWCVFTAEGHQAQRHPIEIGKRNDVEAEIRSGLKAGERVIVHPTDRISSGASIRY